MVSVALTELSEPERDKLVGWLTREECDKVMTCIRAEVANLETAATGHLLKKPGIFLREQKISPDSGEMLLVACRYQIFLQVLEELRKPEFRFKKGQPQIV